MKRLVSALVLFLAWGKLRAIEMALQHKNDLLEDESDPFIRADIMKSRAVLKLMHGKATDYYLALSGSRSGPTMEVA